MYSKDRIDTIRKMQIQLGLSGRDIGCHDHESIDDHLKRISQQQLNRPLSQPTLEEQWEADRAPLIVAVFRDDEYDLPTDEEIKEHEEKWEYERSMYFFFKEWNKYL